MIQIDGVSLNLTQPDTLKGITIRPGGFIEQRVGGITTRMEHEKSCASLNPQPAPCNCKLSRAAALEA